MTATARIAYKAILATVMAVALVTPMSAGASAGSPQICNSSASCKIGEYLYDDNYIPVTSGTCTLTSRYPDGTLYLNSQSMTGTSDGWYEHTFTAPATTGYYRSQVCCTVGSDYMCLDKSFEVVTASSSLTSADIASEVWGYSSRTMTGFGSLVSDVWGHSSRSLSSWGSLVGDIWGHTSRTVTADTDSDEISDIEKNVQESRLLLERLVNKPIIQNFIEEDGPDLKAKLEQSKTTTDQLYLNNQVVVSQMGVLMLGWEEMTGEEVQKALGEMMTAVGSAQDTSGANNIVGQTAWMAENWEWKEVESANKQAVALANSLSRVEKKFKGSGGWAAAYSEAKNSLILAENLEKLIGDSTGTTGSKTVFGRLNEVSQLALAWDERQSEADNLLLGLKQGSAGLSQTKIDELTKSVLAVNRVPKGVEAFKSGKLNGDAAKTAKNKLLAIKGLIEANRTYLAKGEGQVLANTWLELGSIVFKSLVTNPSKLISQEVELKYYLPPEIKKEDILETEEGLSVNYDAEKDQYFVEGKYLLKANESKTISVRVEDIWVITKEELDSLRRQVEELSKPLENTPLFAQGVTLKSDIDVALDKIEVLQAAAVTPEQDIRAWREAQIEMGGVKVKIEKMKELVAQVSSSRNLFGFVGGAQAIAVWGLIIILVAGFVFLALYMKMISVSTRKAMVQEEEEVHHKVKQDHHQKEGQKFGWRMVMMLIVISLLSAIISGFLVRQMTLASLPPTAGGLAEVEPTAGPTPGPVETHEAAPLPETGDMVLGEQVEGRGGPDMVIVRVKPGAWVNIRETPALDSQVVSELNETTEVERLNTEEGWVEILTEEGESGWVASRFVQEIKE